MNYIFKVIISLALLRYGHGQAVSVALDPIADVTEGTDDFFVLSVLANDTVGSDITVTFWVDTTNSDAIPGYDFGGTGTYNCIIPTNGTNCTRFVAISNDTLIEPNEDVTIDLTDAESLIIDPVANTEMFTIIDSGDTAKVQVNFRESVYEISEDGSSVTLHLDFSDDNGLPTIINGGLDISALVIFPRINTLDTATGGDDYGNSLPPIVLPYDKSTESVSFSVDIVNDTDIEATEVFYISLGTFTADTYAELGSLRGEITIRINDNDAEDFFCLSTTPETFRASSAPFTFYAVSNQASIVDAVKWKKSNLPSFLGTLTVLTDETSNYAQKLTVNELKRNSKRRFGSYTFTSGSRSCTVFIRAQNDVLSYPPNVAQKYTVTIYPRAIGDTALDTSLTFGISYTPTKRRNRLIWKRDNRRIRNTATTLTLTDTSAAGIFQVSRPKRGRKGWFAIIQIIAADCPEGVYKDGMGVCQSGLLCGTCYNGGICKENTGFCTCQPCFKGRSCDLVEATAGTVGQSSRNKCTDFGSNSACKGALFCDDGNYGCTCFCGWTGTDCTTKCSGGKFGAGCTQTCHCDDNTFCNFRTGVCSTGTCETGYEGDNCQIPI